MKERHKWNESAVSESIGFVLIFTLVLTGIGLVTLYGYPELLKNQINADERNMEQNMITLQNDIKLLSYSNIPYRDLAMRVAGGSLTVFNSSAAAATQHLEIQYYNGSAWPTMKFYPGEIRYDSEAGSAIISLENGAVLKRQELTPGSFMLAQPRWFVDDHDGKRTFVIFLVGIDTDNKMLTTTGVGNIRMSREIPKVIDIDYTPNSRNVNVTYVSGGSNYDYQNAWNTYFSGSYIVDGGLNEIASDTYQLNNVNRLVIKMYNVTVESF
jgi:hypothetical protein